MSPLDPSLAHNGSGGCLAQPTEYIWYDLPPIPSTLFLSVQRSWIHADCSSTEGFKHAVQQQNSRGACALCSISISETGGQRRWDQSPVNQQIAQGLRQRLSFSPNPHSITLSAFTWWPLLMRMYMYAWIIHEIHCFLVAEALATSSFLIEVCVWSPWLNGKQHLMEFVACFK